jgi:excisionase family DNA binding protein
MLQLKKGHFLTIDEVAKILKVNKRTVYRWIEAGDLRAARLGKKTYRVFESDLKRFIRKRTR